MTSHEPRLHEARTDRRLSLAVVGAGAAGLTAAHLLARRHEVTLFEQEERLGGHAHTVFVPDGPDEGTALDVGFMVLNDRNYPTMHRLLADLGVGRVGASEMSFGYCSYDASVQYALNLGPSAQSAAPARPPAPGAKGVLVEHIGEIFRFMRRAGRDAREGVAEGVSLGDYLRDCGASDWLVHCYVVPMGAAIWSTRPERMLRFPAQQYLEFYQNHGLFSLTDGPQWQYIPGGSVSYVRQVERRFPGAIRRGRPVVGVERPGDEVLVRLAGGEALRFDGVVLATQADQALALLAEPDEQERSSLGAWEYQDNPAVLHWDEAQMPPDPAAWASWNYRQDAPEREAARLSVTYHLNRLQGHTGTARQYFLTMNGLRPIDPAKVLKAIAFRHPTYAEGCFEAQQALRARNGARRTYYCGSYLGYGFHEAAIRSAVDVAELFGITL